MLYKFQNDWNKNQNDWWQNRLDKKYVPNMFCQNCTAMQNTEG